MKFKTDDSIFFKERTINKRVTGPQFLPVITGRNCGLFPALEEESKKIKQSISKLFYKLRLLMAFTLLWLGSFAQMNYDYTAGKFMIKGTVLDVETARPIPLANILITNNKKGITCDNEGNFTMYVSKKDTLRFSSTGYITKIIHISDIDSSKYYTLEIQLLKDFIRLKQVTIYPYRDLDDFKFAFVGARDLNKIYPGIAPPKYGNNARPKFYNPISYLYDRLKNRSSADPNFKP